MSYTSKRNVVSIHLGVFLLCVTLFPVNAWALDPLGDIVVLKGLGLDFASTFFESSLALLKV